MRGKKREKSRKSQAMHDTIANHPLTCVQAVLKLWPAHLSPLYTLGMTFYGTEYFFGQFMSAVTILHGNRRVLDLGHALLPNKQNICELSSFSYWIQNTVCTSYMKQLLQATKKKNKLYPSPYQDGCMKSRHTQGSLLQMRQCALAGGWKVVLMASYSQDSSVKFWCVYFEEILTPLS